MFDGKNLCEGLLINKIVLTLIAIGFIAIVCYWRLKNWDKPEEAAGAFLTIVTLVAGSVWYPISQMPISALWPAILVGMLLYTGTYARFLQNDALPEKREKATRWRMIAGCIMLVGYAMMALIFRVHSGSAISFPGEFTTNELILLRILLFGAVIFLLVALYRSLNRTVFPVAPALRRWVLLSMGIYLLIFLGLTVWALVS